MVIMVDALLNFSRPLVDLARLAGPIFDKELRVSSRRRRNYALRSAYVVLLCLFIMYAWLATLRFAGPTTAAFRASRMALAGRRIITAVIWFQFVAAQLMAIVILSTSISGEIRQRTLSVLMTSPINSLQIVAGKLLSGLLQVMLLAAISLPLLAIIRVLGGVPWDSVVSGICITLTAALLAGSISLLLSTICRQAYTVVLTVMTGYFVAFGASSALVNLLSRYGVLSSALTDILLYVLNPFGAIFAALSSARTAAAVALWPAHCAVMLAASAAVLSLAVLRVRKTALGRAFSPTSKRKTYSPLKRVTGAPVVWKEMRRRSLGHGKTKAALLAVVVVLGIAMFFGITAGGGQSPILYSYLMTGLALIVFVRLAILSAASITAEKEAGTWPILLATPLDDKRILRGKAVAAFRRALPLLVFLLLFHIVFYAGIMMSSGGRIRGPFGIYLLYYAVSLLGTALFVIGVGLYLGIRMKSTNAAVATTVGIYIALQLFGPRLLVSLLYGLVLVRLLGPARGNVWLLSLIFTLIPACVFAALGLLALTRATRRLRHCIF